MTRQYIGARYVPKFRGTYDATTAYEALDVVDNGMGTTYIAKIPTPAGTPLNDPTYWAVYGASSGAIIQLQNDMTQAQNDIVSLQLLADRHVIMISDSYGTLTNSNGDTIFDIFQAGTGLDSDRFYHNNVNGAAFASTTPTATFLAVLQGVTVTDPDKITDVIVVCGANDAEYTVANTLTAVGTFKTYVNSTYQNARITIVPVGKTFTTAGMNKANTQLYKALESVQGMGIDIAWDFKYLLRNTKVLASDLVHPTADGVDILGNNLVSWFEGAGIENSFTLKFGPYGTESISATLSSDQSALTVATNRFPYQSRNYGSVTTCGGNTTTFARLSIDGTTPFDVAAGAGFDIAFSNTLEVGRSDAFPEFSVRVLNATTLANTYEATAYWDVTTTAKVLKIRMLQPIASADNARYVDIIATFTQSE